MPNDFSEFQGECVAITGGAGVLCTAFAEGFARAGAKIALLDLNADAARSSAERIAGKFGVPTLGVGCDVLSREALEAAAAEIEAALGPVDILVNGAGGNVAAATTELERANPGDTAGSFYELPIDAFGRAFDLNCLGTVLPTQVLTRSMHARGAGVILNVSSMNAFKPLTRIPAYSAAKCAVSNFTEWLAVHLAPAGIRVNAIAPGFFLTEQLKFLAYDENGRLTPRYEKVLAKTAMGRLGEPEELQGPALFLCSDLARYITGVILPVDGGFNAASGV